MLIFQYENEVSWPVYNVLHKAMLAHAIYTIRKGQLTNRNIKEIVREAIADMQMSGHERELEHYIKGFATTPNWHTFPIDFFRHTGLLLSRADLVQLFTVENVQRVIAMLEVGVVATTPHHFNALK